MYSKRLITAFVIATVFSGCGDKNSSTPESDPHQQVDITPAEITAITEQSEAFKPRLNDTGITWGGNYPKDINDDCTAAVNSEQLPEGESVQGDILAQQDCANGRDGSSPAFVYTKIAADGQKLDSTAQQWACVLDEITGLLWEAKAPGDGEYGNAGLHDADDLFTWYNSDPSQNGGAIGDWNSRFNQCAGYQQGQPMTYCNIEEFTRRVNEAGLCGFADWQVPTRAQLESLVNYGQTRPAVDTAFFPNTKNEFYWSSSATAGFKESAWGVSFQFGYSAGLPRNNSRHARLVREWQSAETPRQN